MPASTNYPIVFRSLLHLKCPACGKDILVNFARLSPFRTCLDCGGQVPVSAAGQSRFPERWDHSPAA